MLLGSSRADLGMETRSAFRAGVGAEQGFFLRKRRPVLWAVPKGIMGLRVGPGWVSPGLEGRVPAGPWASRSHREWCPAQTEGELRADALWPGLTAHGLPFQTVVTNSTLVAVCVNAASPFLSFNTSLNCTTGMGRRHLARRPRAAPLAASEHAFPLPYSLLPGLPPVSERLVTQGRPRHPLPRDRQLVPLPAARVPRES